MFDDFAANDQLADTELQAVVKAVREQKRFNMMRPVRIPVGTSGQDPVNFRFPAYMLAKVDELCGKDKHYRNRSEYLRHWAFAGLAAHSICEPSDEFDPVVSEAILVDHQERMRALDASIEKCDTLLEKADGIEERQNLLAELGSLRDFCETHGYFKRLKRIDNVFTDRQL